MLRFSPENVFAKRLLVFIKRLDISQRKCAELFGVSRSKMRRMLFEGHVPHAPELAVMLYGVTGEQHALIESRALLNAHAETLRS